MAKEAVRSGLTPTLTGTLSSFLAYAFLLLFMFLCGVSVSRRFLFLTFKLRSFDLEMGKKLESQQLGS